jgi:hypothetical protein
MIAGHSSITITQRYIHPQADAIERVFAAAGNSALVRRRRQVGGHKFVHKQNRIKLQAAVNDWCERGDSNPHGFTRQILSLHTSTDSKADKDVNPADSGKVLQNTQLPRNQKGRAM